MNNKKKNKNRPKPPKVLQKLDPVECDKQENPSNVTTDLKLEIEQKEELSALTSVSDVEFSKDEKITMVETPHKPERGKGKKNQELQHDNTQANKDENKLIGDMQSQEEDPKETLIVTPKARKKKNKDKKQHESKDIIKTDIDAIVKIDSKGDTDIIQEIKDSIENIPQADKKQEIDTKILKKKKKKRNRNDSEKSDVVESQETESCQPTLDKNMSSKPEVILLDDSQIIVTTKDDISTSIDTNLVDTSIIPNFNQDEKEENCKIKKKNKKHKQHQQKTDDADSKNEINISLNVKNKQEADCSESYEFSSLGEGTSKTKGPKVKERKRKVISDKQSTPSEEPHENLPKKTTIVDNVFPLDNIEKPTMDTKEQSNTNEIIPQIDNKEIQEEKSSATLDEVLLDNNQSVKALDDFSDDIFMEVKSTKKKKKQSQKKIIMPEEQYDSNIDMTTEIASVSSAQNMSEKLEKEHKDMVNTVNLPLSEEIQDKVVTDEADQPISSVPDIIQYPRSESQQLLFDNTNNTVIKEILPTNENKLEIPICTSVPIIQGSGETPETKIQQDPLSIKLIEIDSKLDKCVQEKTDIKSKMMEVNQDMEELRLSIERSLAELTALDKGDKEFEKKAQDKILSIDDNIILNQAEKENQSIKLSMPSILVEKPAISCEDKEIKLRTKNSPETEITIHCKDNKDEEAIRGECSADHTIPPVCPSRKDNKGKSKSKKKSKLESASATASCTSQQVTNDNKNEEKSSTKKETEKSDQKQEETQKGKQQSLAADIENNIPMDDIPHTTSASNFEPIEKFEDALTSSVDDVNQTFEIIASEASQFQQNVDNSQINIVGPTENERNGQNVKENPVTPPKNLLGHPDIPVPSNKTDYKKEKNKTPNTQRAKVKIKDAVEIEKTEKMSKQSQTHNKRSNLKTIHGSESFSYMTNGNNEYIYKYSFRKVYLQNFCITCKKNLTQRFPCKFCSLVFYCSQKHMDEDYPQHQPLCFAVSTISHLKDQKHIYADAKGITGQDFRVLRMQMIVSCEKILKRKLVPWEQEALLYPRICADINCREWIQSKLKDCEGCEQISYCSDHAEHLPTNHTRWCKSYALYQKLVNYQQTKGRLEPPMPTKILENHVIPEKINEVLASMYEEKIDMNDIQYAALTQLATSPLTVAYSYQLFTSNMNLAKNRLPKKTCFTVHVVGAELQFEADGLNKWEVFLLHLRPDIKDLRIVLIGPDLNPSNLPLDLLGKVKLCEYCETNRRKVTFSFHDKLTYHEYYSSDHFTIPDIVCAFNPSIQRSSVYNGRDSWPSTIRCILKQKLPFVVTSYTLEELQRDLVRAKEFGDFNVVSEAKHNPFASVRPDRNFITDHEIPLLFKNYCLSVVCGI